MQLQSKCFNLAHLSHWNKMLMTAVTDNTALIVSTYQDKLFFSTPEKSTHHSLLQLNSQAGSSTGKTHNNSLTREWAVLPALWGLFQSRYQPLHVCWSKSLVSLQPKAILAISAQYRVPKANMHIHKIQLQKLLNTWVWRWNMIYTQSKKLATGHFSNSWGKRENHLTS